jgi:hypothetical protein
MRRWEQATSAEIDQLYELAMKEKAFSALVEVQWFITEQVEEEKTAREIVSKFHLAKDNPAAIMDLDRELGRRTPDGAGHAALAAAHHHPRHRRVAQHAGDRRAAQPPRRRASGGQGVRAGLAAGPARGHRLLRWHGAAGAEAHEQQGCAG